ncbi:MAG: RNA 2',3'-cyclic phosphodiesterase [Pseudomonadota bacterium]
MRAFVAVPCPPEWEGPLEEIQRQIPVGRAVPSENLHVTLAFLGDVDLPELEELHDRLEGARLSPAMLQPAGLAQLGDRALALDLEPEPGLVALQAAVSRATYNAGISLERRRFRPHITLLRFSKLTPGGRGALEAAVARLTMPEIAASAVREAVLYRSELHHGGAVYEALSAYPVR